MHAFEIGPNTASILTRNAAPFDLTTRKFLGDFHAFFTNHGYNMGKLYPEGVAFKSYDLNHEDFIGPNDIACRSGRTDLIAALRCPPL